MIKLDDDLLKELGLAGLPPEEKKKLLAHIYETLEMRVGMKLAEQMSDAQLSEFEQFIDSNNEAGALQWLEANFPNYKDVVAAEFNILKMEISQVAPQIAAAAQQQQLMQQQNPGQQSVDPRMYQQTTAQPYYPQQPAPAGHPSQQHPPVQYGPMPPQPGQHPAQQPGQQPPYGYGSPPQIPPQQ
jgi:hypothetical protein